MKGTGEFKIQKYAKLLSSFQETGSLKKYELIENGILCLFCDAKKHTCLESQLSISEASKMYLM